MSRTNSRVGTKISFLESQNKRNSLFSSFDYYNDNPEKIEVKKMWNFLEKICPKFQVSVPIAKYNHRGILITDIEEMKKLLILEYKQRFRKRPVRPDLIGLRERKQKVFQSLFIKANDLKCSDFTLSDLQKALSDLKDKKSRDPNGYINEIFKSDVIGQDLKLSLLN